MTFWTPVTLWHQCVLLLLVCVVSRPWPENSSPTLHTSLQTDLWKPKFDEHWLYMCLWIMLLVNCIDHLLDGSHCFIKLQTTMCSIFIFHALGDVKYSFFDSLDISVCCWCKIQNEQLVIADFQNWVPYF